MTGRSLPVGVPCGICTAPITGWRSEDVVPTAWPCGHSEDEILTAGILAGRTRGPGMKPQDLAVYDQYPRLLAVLTAATQQIRALPLDLMLSACDRMLLTGTYTHNGVKVTPKPDQVVRQKELITAAQALADVANNAVTAAGVSSGLVRRDG